MTPKKLTRAQRYTLLFVAKHGPCYRPDDYHGYSHSGYVRRDLWERCHERGWLSQLGLEPGQSVLTEAGRAVLAASSPAPKAPSDD